LNGLRPPAEGGGPKLASLKAGELIEEFIDPKCALPGNVSVRGDNELGSNVIVESTVRPSPNGCGVSSSSPGRGVGGVGVRGGAGIGRLEAIAISRKVEVS